MARKKLPKVKIPKAKLPKLPKIPKIDFDIGKYKGSVTCNKKKCSVKARKKGFFEDLMG